MLVVNNTFVLQNVMRVRSPVETTDKLKSTNLSTAPTVTAIRPMNHTNGPRL